MVSNFAYFSWLFQIPHRFRDAGLADMETGSPCKLDCDDEILDVFLAAYPERDVKKRDKDALV